MVSLDTIETEIMELEKRDTTYAVLERLAWLYICKDHMNSELIQEQQKVSLLNSKSDFLAAVDGLPIEDVLEVIDEHMEAIRVLYPSEYSAIISKLSSITK